MCGSVFDFHEGPFLQLVIAPPNNSPVHHCIHVSSSHQGPQAILLAALIIMHFPLWRGGWSDLQLFEHECLCRKRVLSWNLECCYLGCYLFHLNWKGQLQREWRISIHKELHDKDKGQWVQLHWRGLDIRKNFFTARTINHCNSLSRNVAEST